jgi:hypothetical protein
MKLACGALLAWLGSCASAPTPVEEWQRVEIAAGPHGLDEGSWAPLDARVVGALTWSGRRPGWPCGIEAGAQYARAESQDESVASGADFFDIRVGAAWEWRAFDWLELVCGAGPHFSRVNVEEPGTFMPVTEDDVSIGIYAHAGAFVRVFGSLAVGVEGQWADGTDYHVLGESRSASTAELLVALRWDF